MTSISRIARQTGVIVLALGFATVCFADPDPAPAWDYLKFDLPSGAPEKVWRDALAAKLGGRTEVKIDGGRIDMMTDTEVFELDWPHKWHEGFGQAMHYADATGKKGVLALISYSQGPENLQEKSRQRFDMVKAECDKRGIRLLVLFPTRPEEPRKQEATKP